MKDLRACIRSLLLADAQINAAVGGSRIYPSILPQGQKEPSIVQNLISEVIGYRMAGDDNLMQARVQLDAWAQTADKAVSLSSLVFERLSGYKGLTPYGSNSPLDTMDLKGVFSDQGRDDYDSAALLHVRRRDFLFWYVVR